LNADIVMKSPGIPDKSGIVKKIKEKRIQIVSEIEFAASFTKAITIGITGSNGKTTTTMLDLSFVKISWIKCGFRR
jgi:UDP-N-acetylmuramoylalanine--D-glutamate ligase